MDSPSGPQTSSDHEQSAPRYRRASPRINASEIDWESVSDDWRTGSADDEHIKRGVVTSTLGVWAR